MNRYEMLNRLMKEYTESSDKVTVLSELVSMLKSTYGRVGFYVRKDFSFLKERLGDSEPEIVFGDRKESFGDYVTFDIKSFNETIGCIEVEGLVEEDREDMDHLISFVGQVVEHEIERKNMVGMVSDLVDVVRVVHEMAEKDTLTEMTEHMISMVVDRVAVRSVGVYYIEDGQYLYNEGSYLWGKKFTDVEGYVEKVVGSRERLRVNNANDLELIVFPLGSEGKVVGAVIIESGREYGFRDEEVWLFESLINYASEIFRSAQLVEDLQDRVNVDELTGLLTRGYMESELVERLCSGVGGSYLMIDVDDFKKINDMYGHDVGDHVLLGVTDVLKDNVGSRGMVARWGGEEFAVFLEGAGIEESCDVANRVVSSVRDGAVCGITVSCGVAVWDGEESYETLFNRADKALFQAKRLGKNCYVLG